MSEPAVKQRLRRARKRIMEQWTARGWNVYFEYDRPYRLLAKKKGRVRIIDVEFENNRQNEISVK